MRKVLRVAPLPTTVVDTIGAGDAYMTGLIAGLDPTPEFLRRPSRLDVEELDKLGRLAAAVAGLTVAQAGANPPTRTQLDTEMNRRLDAAH